MSNELTYSLMNLHALDRQEMFNLYDQYFQQTNKNINEPAQKKRRIESD